MRPAILPELAPGIGPLVVSWLQSCVRFAKFAFSCRLLRQCPCGFLVFPCVRR